jgi:hypothetical protein
MIHREKDCPAISTRDRKDFGKGGRGSPALPYILLAGIQGRRGGDSSWAITQGPETRLPPELGRTAPAAIQRRAKKGKRCGRSVCCYDTSAPPRKLWKAHEKLCNPRRSAGAAVNVFSCCHVFGCLTSSGCILYAGCAVNAHLSQSRIYSTYRTLFRFPDTLAFVSRASPSLDRLSGSSVYSILLANLCAETR